MKYLNDENLLAKYIKKIEKYINNYINKVIEKYIEDNFYELRRKLIRDYLSKSIIKNRRRYKNLNERLIRWEKALISAATDRKEEI